MPLCEGTRRKVVPVPGQGSQCCPSLARGLLEGLFERVCYKRRGARRIETDFPSPSRCPAGNSTPWLCRNNLLLQLYREGGVGFARFFWLPPPSVFFLFTKAAAARWLSWPSPPQGESSLFRKLVPGARSSQVAHAPGTPVSSARFYSCPLAFSLFGERGVVWKIIILFFFLSGTVVV